jgi:CHAD domain-containing protein
MGTSDIHHGTATTSTATAKTVAGGGAGRAGQHTNSLGGQQRFGKHPGRHAPAGEVVLAYLDKHAARLRVLAPAAARDEPDAIHQMRVATRRVRSTLQAFPSVLPRDKTAHLRAELKWLGSVLGEARDDEVISGALEQELASLPPELVLGPAQARVRASLAPQQAQDREAVAEALGSPRYTALTRDLTRLIDRPPFAGAAGEPADKVLPAAVGRAWRRTRRQMEHAQRLRADSRQHTATRDTALHETRKAAKRARYAAEAARPALGKPAKRFAKRMKAVQSALGDHHDAVGARAAARDIGVHASLAGENAFTFGLLYERAVVAGQDADRHAARAWKRAEKKKTLKWLR